MKMGRLKFVVLGVLAMVLVSGVGCLSYSHGQYAKRAEGARVLPEGVLPRKGRIYFVSFPENRLAISLWGWKPNIGHASLVTKDEAGRVAQYDYGWFVGGGRGVRGMRLGM